MSATPPPVDRSVEDHPVFIGANAAEAYAALEGSGGIPLTGEQGYWDTQLGYDIMYCYAGPERVISPIVLGARKDYGHDVQPDRAEPRVPMVRPSALVN